MKQFLREENFRRGAVFAALCLAGTMPYLIYYFFVGYAEQIERLSAGTPKSVIFISQAVAMYVALLISGTAGFAWADGKRVVGLGSARSTVENLYWLAPVAVVIVVLTHFLLDNALTRQDMLYTPRHPVIALVVPLKSAFFEEGILRFGILTIMYRLTRNKWAAMTISSLAGIAFGLPHLSFTGLQIEWNLGIALQLISRFSVGLFVGYVYCRWGLRSSMALRFIIDLKYVFIAL